MRRLTMQWIAVVFAATGPASIQAQSLADTPTVVDVVIRNGTVVDGRGGPGVKADVAIAAGKIVGVGPLGGVTGKVTIDAQDRVVCPGFIDLHSHADGGIAEFRAAENYIRQGVTTLVCGNCGSAPVEVTKFLEQIDDGGTGPNVALLVGHGSVRREIVGTLNVPATAEQLIRMKRLVRQCMEAGAVGLSTGLTYSPGAYGSTEEIIELAKEIAPLGGFYATHMRSEGTRVLEALDEALRIGREAGVPVHISHHKISDVSVFGLTRLTLERIDAARAAGQEVTLDQYPYAAGSGSLSFYVPQDSLSGGIEAYRRRIADPNQRPAIVAQVEALFLRKLFEADRKADDPATIAKALARVQIARAADDPKLAGKNLTEILRARGKELTVRNGAEALVDLVGRGATGINHTLDDAAGGDVERVMRHPLTSIASDGSVFAFGKDNPHPRSYGCYPRVLGLYVRERKLLSLADAVRKMTSLPAARLGWTDRGVIEVGTWADVVVFDPTTIADKATFLEPHQHSIGVDHVLVCGQFVLKDGRMTGALPGRALGRATQKSSSHVTVDADSIVRYVESCRKPNGAFGPIDQEYTDAAWNFPAVETLALLGEKIDRPESVLAHGLGYPRGHAGYGHRQFFHEHLLRRRLGKPTVAANVQVAVRHQGFEPRYYGSPLGTDDKLLFQAGAEGEPDPRDVAAKSLGYYNLSSLYLLLAGLEASGREPADPETLVKYVRSRQAPQGGFVDVRTENGIPRDEDAHVASTFCALASLRLMGELPERVADCVQFVQRCRKPSGGHGWNPAGDLPGNAADVYYTWAALRSLDLLGAKPENPEQTRDWLNTLANADGGFGDQPGWRSRLYSTYYAVDALSRLGSDARSAVSTKQLRKPQIQPIADGEFQIYQALFKVPVVAAGDLAGLSRRGFNLLALKSDKFEDAAALLPAIRDQKLPLDVVLCPEAYPHRLLGLGGVTYNHVGNFTLDPRSSAAEQVAWRTADEVGAKGLPWSEYRQVVLTPHRAGGGLCFPEQDFEQEHAYIAYADGGYNAVLAGFNWAPRDFVRVFPWRERYVDRLTPIADADAHGDLAKWSPQLDHTRMLYLANDTSYAGFLEAAKAGRVVTVIAQPEGVASGASYYGRAEAVEFVKKRVDHWRWWKKG